MDRLAQLLITVSRLDSRLSLVVRLVQTIKFVGLLILVSIGLIVSIHPPMGRQKGLQRGKGSTSRG